MEDGEAAIGVETREKIIKSGHLSPLWLKYRGSTIDIILFNGSAFFSSIHGRLTCPKQRQIEV